MAWWLVYWHFWVPESYKKRQKETGEGAGTYCGRRTEATGISPELVVAGILILFQLVVVVLYAHMDEDDAFYVGTATTAVETDSLYAYNPYTGAAYNVLPSRYILSPFPAFLAVTSRLCGGLHPAIVAHTVFPAVFVFLAYVVLFQYSRIFFKGKAGEQGIFMILCAVILWFCGYSVYNSEIFTMGRIWQGKAVLAGVFLPFLFLLCMEIFMQENRNIHGAWLFWQMEPAVCFPQWDHACPSSDGSICSA